MVTILASLGSWVSLLLLFFHALNRSYLSYFEELKYVALARFVYHLRLHPPAIALLHQVLQSPYLRCLVLQTTMKVSSIALLLLPLAHSACAWTSSPHASVSAHHRRSRSSTLAATPTFLGSTTVDAAEKVKDADALAIEEEAAAAAVTNTNERTFGTVSTSKLNKLYDLVVIGGGPAGVAGAIKAAQMGRRAILIDKPKFDAGVLPNGLDLFFGGPTGLFSKALRDSAKNTNVAAMRAQHMDSDVIWKQITNDIVKLAMRNAEGQCRTLARYGIDYLQGSAQLLGEDDDKNVNALKKFKNDLDSPENGVRSVSVSNTVLVDKDGNLMEESEVTVTGTKVLVATGSKSTRLRGIPFEQSHRVFDSDTINLLGYFPRSVTISGLGIIGIEFANIFNALGVKDVKILVRGDVESSTKKLGMDMDVANELMRLLRESGVQILERTTIEEFSYVPPPEKTDEYIQMKLTDGSTIESDLFFAATGRFPAGKNEDTGLEAAGVDVADRGMINIDKKSLVTSSKNVYAAGDVIGAPALASTSMEQAQRAVSAMFTESCDDDVAKESNHDDPLSIGVW
jgi:NAD(P) transhydrogenase